MKRPWVAPFLLVLAGFAAYHNSFQGAFLFDDFRHIVDNARIRDLSLPLQVGSGTTRPLTAWTFALNYAVGGLDVQGYHAVNLAIHLATALALFTLLIRHLKPELAFFASLVWLVHPLQTQPVNYIVQRSELLMGLFYLLMLCSLGRNKILCVAYCALGMASKPVMVTAPVLALLYDRFFLSSSWRDLWRRRGRLHLWLFSTYGILALCLLNGPDEYIADVGFHLPHVHPAGYLLAQGKVVLHYLRLVIWPTRLVFDYGWPAAAAPEALRLWLGEATPGASALRPWLGEATPGASALRPWLVLLALLTLTAWVCRHRPALGFLGVWFFLLLAPTSLIPIADLAFEHRMYLPLAAPVVLFVLAVDRLIRSRPAKIGLLTAAAFTLGIVTVQRNTVYRSAVDLWKDTVSKRPQHPRANSNLGAAFQMEGKIEEAIMAYQTALRLEPEQSDVYSNLGCLLENQGDLAGACRYLEMALHLNPTQPKAARNLARVLHREGLELTRQARWAEAERKLSEAVLWNPNDADLWNNLGTAEDRLGKRNKAALCYTKALQLAPDTRFARENLRKVLRQKFSPALDE